VTLVEILTVALLGLMAIGLPIAFSLIAAGAAALWLTSDIPLMVIPQQVFGAVDSFYLLAVPFFLLAGEVMTLSGMTERLLAFANALVGRVRGGLAVSNVAASTMMAGISGSAIADTSAIGKVMIPAMVRAGYDAPFAAAVTASANVVGPIIPPSIALVVIGVLTNLSIGHLFMAGVGPGLLYAAAMALVAWLISVRRGYPVHERAGLRQVLSAARAAAWALALPVLIVGGIRLGVFNVTECAAFAAAYALFVGIVVYRAVTPAVLLQALVNTGHTTAVVALVIGGAQVVSWLLAYNDVPQEIARLILSVSREPWVFLLMVNVLLVFIGTFMENGPAMVMLVPVLFPVATALGIDPIHFAVVISVNLVIGLITPPVALCVSIAAVIGRISAEAAMRAVWPFLGAAMAVQLLITFVPGIALGIPRLLGYGG
jgi:tripartite ATP-independent transporter DctM subunit